VHISDVMTRDVVTVTPDTSMAEVACRMRERHIGDVLLVDGNRVRGIVTDRDLVIRGLAAGRDPRLTPIADLCTPAVVVVSTDASTNKAVALMRSAAVRRLPAIADGQLRGVVSIGDLAIAHDQRSALAAISAFPPDP
jgi:CBS domain-containing protein